MSPRMLLSSLVLACMLPAQAVPIFPPPLPFLSTGRTEVFEYVNEISGHYVLLAVADEMAAVDRGDAGPGWRHTGHSFGEEWSVLTFTPNFKPDFAPVCRYYSPTYNSHFFSADAEECIRLLAGEPQWIQERRTAFEITAPVGSACPSGREPIYRVFNNRHALADANHRYVTSSALRDKMIAAGWRDEGIAFCPSFTRTESIARIYMGGDAQFPATAVASLEGCNARAGTCVALGQLPALTTAIDPWLPPSYVTRNPDYPSSALAAMTGIVGLRLRTSLPEGSPELSAHSFLQSQSIDFPWGIHVNGADRLAGAHASMSPTYRLPDDRTYLWPRFGESTLEVTARAAMVTLRRPSPDAHAYGGPALHFIDGTNGNALWVTLQAFGTVPQGDFVGLDVYTGTPIVSTSFRAQPAFGRRVSGEFTHCVPEVDVACLPMETLFRFALERADFERVLALARTVKPALSADPGRYFLQGFRFQAETYLDASLSMRFHGMFIEIWPF